MNILDPQTLAVELEQIEDGQFCPECGAVMVEADRLKENNAIYIWYRCSEGGCDGQWLTKRPALRAGPESYGF